MRVLYALSHIVASKIYRRGPRLWTFGILWNTAETSASRRARLYLILSSSSGLTLGAVRRNFMRPAPVAPRARFLKKSAAVSTTPTFSATATAIHWFKDTPSSLASRWAAFLMERGSFKGYVALLIIFT